MARTYLLFSLHPICIYLRAQGSTHSLTQAFLASTLLHLPFNYILVTHLRLGISGVITTATASNPYRPIFSSLSSDASGSPASIIARGLHNDCLIGWKLFLCLTALSYLHLP
ncbi:hypothetical protein HN51_061351 [Arachis hypogaea]